MHEFQRGDAPVDLELMKKRYSVWEKFCKSQEHAILGDALYHRQGHYCAYCETFLKKKDDGFIEHLERRSDVPKRTFDWSNLYFSCKNHDSCGVFKDDSKPRMKINAEKIIDPARENPQDYFIYDMNGGISSRDEAHQAKAEETIRVFNLRNSPRLKNIRKNIGRTVEAILQNAEDENDILCYMDSLKDCDCISVYKSLLKIS